MPALTGYISRGHLFRPSCCGPAITYLYHEPTANPLYNTALHPGYVTPKLSQTATECGDKQYRHKKDAHKQAWLRVLDAASCAGSGRLANPPPSPMSPREGPRENPRTPVGADETPEQPGSTNTTLPLIQSKHLPPKSNEHIPRGRFFSRQTFRRQNEEGVAVFHLLPQN